MIPLNNLFFFVMFQEIQCPYCGTLFEPVTADGKPPRCPHCGIYIDNESK